MENKTETDILQTKKLHALCDVITNQSLERLKIEKLDCKANLDNAVAHYHSTKKYTKINTGTSGKYMVYLY